MLRNRLKELLGKGLVIYQLVKLSNQTCWSEKKKIVHTYWKQCILWKWFSSPVLYREVLIEGRLRKVGFQEKKKKDAKVKNDGFGGQS